jgi:hypothetical protein
MYSPLPLTLPKMPVGKNHFHRAIAYINGETNVSGDLLLPMRYLFRCV